MKYSNFRILEMLFKSMNRPKGIVAALDYYPIQPSCQIVYLSHLFAKFLGERDTGVFVEIGANNGINCSNTWGLAERGWTGYMVEAIPELAQECRDNHSNHELVSVFESAISDLDDHELKFNVSGALSTANQELKSEYMRTAWARPLVTSREIVLRTKKLDTFLKENGILVGFDLLVIDVEGLESKVFSGFSLDFFSPKMIIIELVDTHPHLKSTSDSDAFLGQQILLAGYEIVYKDVINTVFVRRDVWESAYLLK
jgi:FkbM family methyltransferase